MPDDARANAVGGQTRREIGSLLKGEMWWRDHYYELESLGYKLRPRYHPKWEPSWIRYRKDFYSVEDGQPPLVSGVSLMKAFDA